MRRLVTAGLVVATAAVVYAVAGGRLGLGGLWGQFNSGPRLPALRSQELPFRYPARLWRDGVEGEVVLRIHVTELGQVDSVELQASSGHGTLDTIAMNGAGQLEFHPAQDGDQAVAVWAELPVRFQRRTVTVTPEDE